MLCNYLQNVAAITYIFVLQLSTFLFYNKHLASGLLKGIGEKTADAIIEKFGVNALEILEHQPDRLLEIRGITK